MLKYLGLSKLFYLKEIVSHHGGWVRSALKLFRMDDLKMGKLVGEDKFGNKYYEGDRFFFPRNRWVEYAPHVKLMYDASQVCPEWHGWLHQMTDVRPQDDETMPQHKWMLEHTENLTGTNCQWVPYSTRNPKIQPWIPPKKCK